MGETFDPTLINTAKERIDLVTKQVEQNAKFLMQELGQETVNTRAHVFIDKRRQLLVGTAWD